MVSGGSGSSVFIVIAESEEHARELVRDTWRREHPETLWRLDKFYGVGLLTDDPSHPYVSEDLGDA